MNISDQEQEFQIRDSASQRQDTLAIKTSNPADSFRIKDTVPHNVIVQVSVRQPLLPADTNSVSSRNPVSDVTFYDSSNIVTRLDERQVTRFPFLFTGKNREHETALRTALMKHLRDGKEIPANRLHQDWMILIVLIAGFLYSSIRTFSKSFFPEVLKFFSFRGIGDQASGDLGEIFRWQSTILNLISFFNIALFIHCAASYYDLIPLPLPGILTWLAAFFMVVLAITSRHAVCYLTGQLSGKKQIFNEYMVSVYLSYRYSGLIFFVLAILLSYTTVFRSVVLLDTGIVIAGAIYLIRVIRLLLIFIKRDVSILYLILYLCALEILPVLIITKYFTGLF